ncbi:unnamed protein product, partial [Mesorhabditis spiculigera]
MRQTAGSSFFWYLVASFLMLASVASAFYVPYGEDYYFAPAAEKRSVAFAPRPGSIWSKLQSKIFYKG